MKSLVHNLDREKVVLILEWCQNQFGRSQYYRKYPRLRVYRSFGKSSFRDSEGGLFGTYGTGLISIYLGSHTGMKQLCSTVLHEYRHYLLSIQEYRSLSRKLEDDGVNISDISEIHPHEIECRRFEKEWADTCFSQLRKKLYSKS
jgi:hypothetical protein